MKLYYFLCFSLLFFAAEARAQSGLVIGKVTDKNQNLSMPGASIKLNPGNRYTISGQTGNFEFLDVPTGTYEVEVAYIGYKKSTASVTVVAGKPATVNFQLEEGAIVGQEVVVLGDRLRGQAKALNQQKTNPNISNIVSADQVGRFPDANIGDAMKRIPGITMQNDQGEARNIIIRGLAPELNSVSLNGDRIPSAEGDNRRVQMDLIPADMIQTIEVNKTLTPDMDGDAIGGSVNLVTRAAPNGLRLSGTLSSGYNPIREKPLYNGSFILGDRFLDKKLGVVLSGSYTDNDYGSDNIEAEWKRDDFGNVFTEDQRIRKYDVQRVRRSISAALDYAINEKNTLYFNSIYNWRDDRENRYQVRTTDIAPEYDDNNQIIGYTGVQNRETKGGIGNSRNKFRRLEDQRVQNYSLKGTHLLGSKVDMDWSATYASAKEDRPNERYLSWETGETAVDGIFSNPQRPEATVNVAPSAFEFDQLTENHDFTREREISGKLNVRFPFSVIADQKGRLRVGGRLRLKNKSRNNNFLEYSPVGQEEALFGNLTNSATATFSGNNFQPGSQYVPGIFSSNHFLGNLPMTNTSLFEPEPVFDEFLAINFSARENIAGGYLRWDQDFSSKFSMITGVRFENTSLRYTGNSIEDEETLTGSRTIRNNYLNVLPSLNFRYVPKEDLVLRAGFGTSIARPNYYDLVPYFDSRPNDQELSVGNPDLKATYAYNFDLMVENYFRNVGIISGGAFYKRLNNFIYVFRDQQYNAQKFGSDFGDVSSPIPAEETWTFTQPRNGSSVDLYGFEVTLQRQLDFLPGFLRHLGVYANYTYTQSKAKGVFNASGEARNDVKLPGTAPHLFNASLSYDATKFTARISLNYAGAYADELGGEAFEDVYYDKQLFLDANASFRITPKLRIFAEANNLTNQALRYYQGISSRTRQIEFYRPRYNAGLKFDLF
ncbi:MAG: TonB-dependent receptor [Mucilaginibacter polytrichastri]|nr:TonB-dependent receptor [Mucilaginibacter polytrichastri]